MPISEAMRARHMVRKYTDKPLPADIVEKLQERIDGLNAEHDVKLWPSSSFLRRACATTS